MAKLFAPPEFWRDKTYLSNGCGPGHTGDMWVPDGLLFCNIKIACSIHDFMYANGENINDKAEADRVFLNNMLRLIAESNPSWLRSIRRWLAGWYYKAVDRYGGPAFWADKNKPEEMREV